MAQLAAAKALPLVGRTLRTCSPLPQVIRGRTRCRAERRSSGKPEEPADLLVQSCPVPKEQQPMMEFQMLQDAFLFDWPLQTLPEFCMRLLGVFSGFFFLVGLPISVVTFSMQDELLQVVASASIGSGFITTLLVLRLYLGYSHVSSRLLSATVEYEETGWYDGQVWVKTPQMLMRDRLLGTYQVKPVLENLKRALLGLSGAMVAATVLLATGPPPKAYSSEIPYPKYTPSDLNTTNIASQANYEQSVADFEPWATDEEGQEAVGRPSLLEHMKRSD